MPPPQASPTVVALIGDNNLVGEGIAALLNEFEELHVVYGHAFEAVTPIDEGDPQVVLLDVGVRRSESLHLVARLRRELPDAKVIVMDQMPVHEDVVEFVNAGVSGFIMKDVAVDDLVNAIHLVEHGENVLPPEMLRAVFSRIACEAVSRPSTMALESVRMTPREREVIGLIAVGLSNKEISVKLNIATHTVKSHVRNVMEKLGLHTRLQIAAFAFSEHAR